MDIEVWKDIPGYENYQASSTGIIRSKVRTQLNVITGTMSVFKGRVLKSNIVYGYKRQSVYANKKEKQFFVHQLVAMAFLGHTPCGHKLVVDHINGNKLDNRVENLRLITNRENIYAHHKGTSKYKGVAWAKDRSKWQTTIFIDGKNRHLGFYTDELEASQAYQAKLKEL